MKNSDSPVFDTPQVSQVIRTAISKYMESCGTGASIDACEIVMEALYAVADEWEAVQDDLIEEEEDNDGQC